MRFYGNKTKILPLIEKVVLQTGLNGNSRFVDLFSGTSSVGKNFKSLGYTVYSNDNLEFGHSLAKTFIELNCIPKFTALKKEIKTQNSGVKKILDYLNNLPLKKGFIYQNYSPAGNRKYFTEKNASKIDSIREQIEVWKKEKFLTKLEYYYLITTLLYSVNLVSNISGTYASFLKIWDRRALKDLVLQPIKVIPSQQNNKAFKSDSNSLIKNLTSDILYLDPPYNNRQYASNYFLLELIAEGWFDNPPKIYGYTGMRPYEEQKSRYSYKGFAQDSLNELVLNADTKYLILSYSNEGIIQHKEIIEILSQFGKLNIMEQVHKRYKSINQSKNSPTKILEKLYVVKKEKKRANNLNGKEWLKNSFSIWKNLGKNEDERKLRHPAIFTASLVKKLIDCFVNQKEYSYLLDPFAGTGTTLVAGLEKNMKVIGFDINQDFKKISDSRTQKRILEATPIVSASDSYNYFIEDSRNLSKKLSSNSIDLCITSPPYWDILNRKRTADNKNNKNYTNLRKDLGNIEVYEDFLDSLSIVFTEIYKVLKPNHYFIVNVMDLRKKSQFFPLHIDCINLSQKIGFNLEDIIIWDRQPEYNNMRPLGYPYKFIINKVHEYLIVLNKRIPK